MENLRKRFDDFLEERDWKQFHTPKSLSMAISVEAAELMEIFQWHDNVDPKDIKEDEEIMARVQEELADVIIYCISMANRLDLDIEEIVENKMKENEKRFDKETADKIMENARKWKE